MGDDRTIAAVRARAVDLRLDRPVETAGGVMATTPLVLIDVHTRDGVVGRSYVRCYTPLALGPLASLVGAVGEALVGSSAAPLTAERAMRRMFRLAGPQGLAGMATAGIDMALWDARAVAAGLPLVTLLGGEPGPVDAYASLRVMDARAAAAEAQELLGLGFTAFKVKVGGRSLADDLAVIRTLRAVIGPDARLMADYNQSLTVTEAIERVRVLDHEGLYWIEEPTTAEDFAGHARIAEAAVTPIQLGENWWGVSDLAKSIAARAGDHAMLDVMKIGGVTGWLRAMAVADAAGLPVSSHTFPEFSSHLLGVTPSATYLEYLDHARPILTEPVVARDGQVWIADRPGAGITWDEAAIARG
ncbi:mandelate racemase [Actinoplanes sp. SE50]|uniref:enolase C-terminal domain-like protein n=1 Tax=unclassified Actinoplanes TaxID=2626549 RepID=UPI00023ECAA6|nr:MULTISPECIES: enolase C-terminal domain-like protein [unclassified Actinoplanes]AEV82610.1 mandelate racemase [Actinoplanes sp. SE50/110]ATO81006.1 mandelate racemase [Actinoplanes sp. SE50]SLL98413.1 mandelate racemase [Actinoplanes sp. SE50/110]